MGTRFFKLHDGTFINLMNVTTISKDKIYTNDGYYNYITEDEYNKLSVYISSYLWT